MVDRVARRNADTIGKKEKDLGVTVDSIGVLQTKPYYPHTNSSTDSSTQEVPLTTREVFDATHRIRVRKVLQMSVYPVPVEQHVRLVYSRAS